MNRMLALYLENKTKETGMSLGLGGEGSGTRVELGRVHELDSASGRALSTPSLGSPLLCLLILAAISIVHSAHIRQLTVGNRMVDPKCTVVTDSFYFISYLVGIYRNLR